MINTNQLSYEGNSLTLKGRPVAMVKRGKNYFIAGTTTHYHKTLWFVRHGVRTLHKPVIYRDQLCCEVNPFVWRDNKRVFNRLTVLASEEDAIRGACCEALSVGVSCVVYKGVDITVVADGDRLLFQNDEGTTYMFVARTATGFDMMWKRSGWYSTLHALTELTVLTRKNTK